MDKIINKSSISFTSNRSHCRRITKDRRRVFYIGGYRGIEKRTVKDRRKGIADRRKSLA